MRDALRERLAEVYGVSSPQVLPVRGFWHGAELVFRLLAVRTGTQIACRASPEFSRLAAIYGASLVERPSAGPAAAFRRFDDAAITLSAEAIEIVDETGVEFSTIPSLAGRGGNILVIREIASDGAQSHVVCAAAIGDAGLISRLADVLEPFALPTIMRDAALAALEPQAMALAKARRARIIDERRALAESFASSRRFLSVRALEQPAVRVTPENAEEFLSAARRWKISVEPADGNSFDIPLAGADGVSRIRDAFDLEPKAAERNGEVTRNTLETKITAFVDLDREDEIDIRTGVGFLDHMLTQIAHHGGISVMLSCAGDLEVDAHHTIEDCAIAFGQALAKALGDRRGIARFGYLLPMDEAEAKVSVDLGGRPFLVFNGEFKSPLIGEYPTEMTEHIFRSLSQALGASIHVSVTGENDHHKTEACFKAFGRALRDAIRIEGERTPSTKGVL